MICLAGFMGSGKTTVGTLLARQLAWRFEDLDVRIEQSTGLAISTIFERRGETAFREIEREEFEKTLGRVAESGEPIVLALGGGTYAQPGMVERPFYEQADYRVAGDDDPTRVVAQILALPPFAKRFTNAREELQQDG